MKFWQRSSAKYFEDLVAREVRPNSKKQFKYIFENLNEVKQSGKLTPAEFDQLFETESCVTEEDILDVAEQFESFEDRSGAKSELKEEFERPSLSAISAKPDEEKKPGKTKRTFIEENTGKEVALKYESETAEEITILPNGNPHLEDDDQLTIKMDGEVNDISIVDN